MTTAITIEKRRTKYKSKPNQNSKKKTKCKSDEKPSAEIKSDEIKKREKPKKPRNATEEVRKMFSSTIDPYDVPLTWWETEHVRYAINYPPVKARLERIMGTHIVRLTDRKYMLRFMAKIKEDNERLQKIRIEKRKLSPPSIVSQLLQLSYKALIEKMKKPGLDKVKLYM